MNEYKLGGLVRTFGDAKVIDVSIHAQGIVVTLRQPSNATYACNPPRPMPDRVWREIFRYNDGEVRKVATQDGIHKPAEYHDEQILFV